MSPPLAIGTGVALALTSGGALLAWGAFSLYRSFALSQPRALLQSPQFLAVLERQERGLRALAEAHGLSVTRDGPSLTLEGRLGPWPLRLSLELQAIDHAHCELLLTQPLPLTDALGAPLSVKRSLPQTLTGFRLPDGDTLSMGYLVGSWRREWDMAPQHISEAARALIQLALQLERAGAPGWHQLAERRGWPLQVSDTSPIRRITGSQGDCAFELTLSQRGDRRSSRIRVDYPSVQAPFTIRHREHGPPGATPINHPIADSLLAVHTRHPQRVLALLQRPEVLEAVMEVAHGVPGSEVHHDHLLLLAHHDIGPTVEDTLAAALRCAEAVSGAPRAAC